MHSKVIFVRHESKKALIPTESGTNGWAYIGSHNLSESAWYVSLTSPASDRAYVFVRETGAVCQRIGAESLNSMPATGNVESWCPRMPHRPGIA